ncbi:MAG: AAA family ATPase, partial [Candidatus Omnitrophica bacterium]|nr:AAA family ATPase [Candidatus Omnitrophota bacterium]
MDDKNEAINFTKQKLDELRKKIQQYGYSYHVFHAPEVSDAEYDDLVQQLRYHEDLYKELLLKEKEVINSAMTSKESKEVVNKALNLFQYLNYFVRLRTSIVQNISQYSSCIWFSEIPYSKLCFCAARELDKEESDSTWVEIKRPTLPKVPTIPSICDNWVNLDTLENHELEPTIKDKIVDDQALKGGVDEPAYLELVNYPEIQSVWSEYLKQKWEPWAELYGELKKVYNIYAKLFSMYQQQKALGEAYEVVLCLGLLDYKTKEGASIYRHIVTAQIELVFEPVRGTISVRSSPEGTNLQFETEMLGVNDQPEIEIQRQLEDSARDIGSDLWHKSKIHPLILSWVNSFNPKAGYNESLDPPQPSYSLDNPEVTFAPAIILRERTKVGTLKFIGKVIENLKDSDTNDVPQSIRTFLTTDDDVESPHSMGDGISENEYNPELKQESIYFPLHYNDEQLRIVRYINGRKGIVVQGPPGTGKSHTIANLVCHLLAEGKRVLITSHTPRALKVLKEKIPKQIQSLCVSILGKNQIDFDNLMGAVHEITNMNNVWDSNKSNDSIAKLEEKLFGLRKKFQNVKVLMTELREKETYKHSIVDSKYNGTAQEIASRLKTEENRYGWIPDSISTNVPQPLSVEEFKKLVELNRALTKDRTKELLLKRINVNEIFSPEEFVGIVENEQVYKAREIEIENDINLRILYNKLKQTNQDKRARLLVTLRLLEKTKEEACRRPLPWLKSAVSEMLGDQDQPLKLLFIETQEYLNGLKETSVNSDKHDFSIPDQVKLQKIKVDVEDLLFHLKSGKSLGWGVFRPKIYKKVIYLLNDTLVDGRACCNIDCLNLLLDYVNVRIKLDKLEELWKSKINIPEGSLASKFGIYFEQGEALEVVISIEKILLLAKEGISELQVISEPAWH